MQTQKHEWSSRNRKSQARFSLMRKRVKFRAKLSEIIVTWSAYLNRRPVGESGMVLLEDDFLGKLWRKGNFLNILGESERSDCWRCVMWCWNQSLCKITSSTKEVEIQSQGERTEKKEKFSGKLDTRNLFSRACITGVLHRASVVSLGLLMVDESCRCYRSRGWNRSKIRWTHWAVDSRNEFLERFAFLVSRRHRFKRPVALFVAVKIKMKLTIGWHDIFAAKLTIADKTALQISLLYWRWLPTPELDSQGLFHSQQSRQSLDRTKERPAFYSPSLWTIHFWAGKLRSKHRRIPSAECPVDNLDCARSKRCELRRYPNA